MKLKIRLISDGPLLIGGIVLSIVCSIMVIVLLGAIEYKNAVSSDFDAFFIKAFFLGLLAIVILTIFSILAKSISLLTLTDSHIQAAMFFNKTISVPYACYTFIYHGYYFRGNLAGIGTNIHYIVFSRKRLPKDVLSQINRLNNTRDTFKIRFTKRNYRKMQKIVPMDIMSRINILLAKDALL